MFYSWAHINNQMGAHHKNINTFVTPLFDIMSVRNCLRLEDIRPLTVSTSNGNIYQYLSPWKSQ